MFKRALTDYLIELIKGLTLAEKKHFRIYAKRNAKDRELLFLKLFDFIDKTKNASETTINKQFSDLSSNQVSDLKAHLYNQLLVSLRLLHNKGVEFKIREQIDWATILYSKGLYKQSSSILAKSKTLAKKWHKNALQFEIVELEKRVEVKQLHRNTKSKINELTSEASTIQKTLMDEMEWSNLAFNTFDLHLKIGTVKNEQEYLATKLVFENFKAKTNTNATSFFGKVRMCKAYLFYSHTCLDFKKGFLYASKCVNLFEEEPEFKKIENELYIISLTNLLEILYLCRDRDRFIKYWNQLKEYLTTNEAAFGENLKYHVFVYADSAQLNLFLLDGNYEDGIDYLKTFFKNWERHQDRLDQQSFLFLNYQIACMYFGLEDYKNAMKYLNIAINQPNDSIREDLQASIRILFLITLFELGYTELLEYQLPAVSRFLIGIKENQKIQSLILNFIKKNMHVDKKNLKPAYINLADSMMDILHNNPYEKRILIHLDLIPWIESKIEGVSMKQIVQNKYLSKSKNRIAS